MKTVLVIEDEAIVAMELEAHLTAFGYTVVGPVASYAEALREAALTPPDLVLADVRIVGARTGLDAAAELMERHGVRLVVLTAHSDAATREEAMMRGASAVMLKPFRPEHLRETLARVLAE